jgi:hypothetical protein
MKAVKRGSGEVTALLLKFPVSLMTSAFLLPRFPASPPIIFR